MSGARINGLHYQGNVEVTFDDFIITSDGGIDFHPDLTTHISGRQWGSLYDGMAFALRLGMVMNVHVTVVWGRIGLRDDNAARERLEDFCAVLRKRASKRGLPCSYVYVHECTRDEGLHTHLLTVWPYMERHDFSLWVINYFAKMAGVPAFDPRAVCVRHKRDGDVDRHWRWFGYITKGTDPKAAFADLDDRFKSHLLRDVMLHHPIDSGVVRCRKRVGVSRDIDMKARTRFGVAGFQSRFVLGANTQSELYTDKCFREYQMQQQGSSFWQKLGPA